MVTTAEENREKVEKVKKKIGKPVGNGRARKPKQKHLPGLEPPSIPKIDKLADRYVAARDDRMAKGNEEIAARDLLEAAMKEAGLAHYETQDGRVVEVIATEKVRVRNQNGESDADE